MGTKVIVNPKTGAMETVSVSDTAAIEALNKTRKALRDMLDGNVQFHTDTLGPDKPKPTEEEQKELYDDGSSYQGFYGYGVHP